MSTPLPSDTSPLPADSDEIVSNECFLKDHYGFSSYITCADTSPLILLWVLRILIILGGSKNFLRATSFSSDELAGVLGLQEELTTHDENFSSPRVLKKLRVKLMDLEKQSSSLRVSDILDRNLRRFQRLFFFSEEDTAILCFCILLHQEQSVEEATDQLGRLNHGQIADVLACTLGISRSRAKSAIAPDGALIRSGLVTFESGSGNLRRQVELISRNFSNRMVNLDDEPLVLLRGVVNSCPAPELVRSDYSHLGEDISLLIDYLRSACSSKRPGVNILFHGPPGTGKTQLAHLLASELARPLYAIASEDRDGDASSGGSRVGAYRLAQTIFTHQPALLIFDEVEDVFGSGSRGARPKSDTSKAWLNRVLEHNPVPTFWITNNVSEIDPAYVRRFDFVLRIGQPPRESREALLVRRCGSILPVDTLRRLSSHVHLAPALITRTAAVLDTIRDQLPPERYEQGLVRMLNESLRAQGHPPISDRSENPLPSFYDPRFINTSVNLEQILDGIRRTGSARICLYGLPGTGKTAFGRYLAEKLGRKLQLTRASDILGPFVGMTESNLADTFAQARSSKSVLLIDEVDSFLQDRAKAGRSWEITAVNEMLTQMESFPGLFIASTNLMTGFDPAALRRFDIKIRFDALREDQAWELFGHHARASNLGDPSNLLRPQLAKLTLLTPGDFAAVERRNRFYPLETAEALVAALAQECAQKTNNGQSRPIGFGIPAH